MGSDTAANHRPHLSASQLDMFCRCPEQYRRRYCEGEILPPGIALAKGSAYHIAAEHNMRQKVDSHVDMQEDDAVAFAVESYEATVRGGLTLQEGETTATVGAAVDDVASLARNHVVLQSPDYQPMFVEQTVRINLPGPRDLLGRVDVVDHAVRVIDFKSAGRKKNQADVDASLQLTVYVAAMRNLGFASAGEVLLDTLVQTPKLKKVSRQVLPSQRNRADLVALGNRINAVSMSIDAGIFPPAVPGSWWCSPKWCGYWGTCPYVNSERKELAK